MATGRNLETESYVAGADLSTKQFYIVKISATDTVVLATSNSRNVGVLQDKPKSGEPCAVMQLGISKVVSDGLAVPIVAGDPLISDGSGRAIKSDGTTGHNVLGFATEASSATGVIIGIDLTRGPYVV